MPGGGRGGRRGRGGAGAGLARGLLPAGLLAASCAGGARAQEPLPEPCGVVLTGLGNPVSLGAGAPPPVLCDASGAPLGAGPGAAGAELFPFAGAAPPPPEVEEFPRAVTVLDPEGAASCLLIARSPEAGGLVAGVSAAPGEYFAMLLTEGGSNATCEDADPLTSALIDAFSSAGLSEPLPWNSTLGWDDADWGEVGEALRNRTGELFAEDGPVRNFLEDVRDQASSALSGLVNRLQSIDLEGALSGLFDLGGGDEPAQAAAGGGDGGESGGGGIGTGVCGGAGG